MEELPIVGSTYNCFDDGKITESRRYEVEVTEVVPFKLIDRETLNLWKKQVKQCYWLYSKETDFFIITNNGEENNSKEVFVRTLNNDWFSIGGFINCGRMDIDGSLAKFN